MKSNLVLLDHFITHHPNDAAKILEQFKPDELRQFLEEMPDNLAVRIFNYLERFTAAQCLELMDKQKSAIVLEKLPLQVSSVFYRRLKNETKNSILNLMNKDKSFQLKRILNFPENSAGALADQLVLTLPEDITVKEAMKRVQKRPEQTIYYLYIINRQQALVGVVSIRELMLANHTQSLSAIMKKNISYIAADLNFKAILNHTGWQEVHAMPVVENDMVFIGVIRYETLRQIEMESKMTGFSKQAINTSNALSELYKIGFSGLIRSATTPLKINSTDKT